VVVAAVDHGNVHRRALERLGGIQPAETAAQDHNPFSISRAATELPCM